MLGVFKNANINAPDFVIGGAMKCGTSTLHSILASHPDIYIPDAELHFFDFDNVIQHPDFYDFYQNNWSCHSGDNLFVPPTEWYNAQYLGRNERFKGEDSTTYLASPKALARLKVVKPDIKIIVMLRQPTKRAYSQYWHMLRTGRATYNFEKTIEFSPESVLSRSLYLEQLKELYKIFPQQQVKVVLFEELIRSRESTIIEVCRFIGADEKLFTDTALTTHANAARLPRFITLQRLKNRLFRKAGNISYKRHFQEDNPKNTYWRDFCLRSINKCHHKLNPLVVKKPPMMNENTRHFLDRYFVNQLEGLDELIGRDVTSLWFNE